MQKQQWSTERLVQINGTLILLLLVFIPVSNAIELLVDPNLHFWFGSSAAWAWLMGCFGIVMLYLVTTQLFFAFGRPEWQNDMMVTYLARTFVSALGVMLILQSFPLYAKAQDASEMLLDQCSFSDRSQSLKNAYETLRVMREDASCKPMRTVEQCDGFRANDYTEYISWAEDKYQCTGLCSHHHDLLFVPAPGQESLADQQSQSDDPYTTPTPFNGQPVKAAGVVQAIPPTLLQGKAAHDARRTTVLSTQMPNVGNALFSHYTYDYHCGHMIASDLKNKGTAMSDTTFAQGIALLVLVLLQSLGELIIEVRRPEPPKRVVSDAFVQP